MLLPLLLLGIVCRSSGPEESGSSIDANEIDFGKRIVASFVRTAASHADFRQMNVNSCGPLVAFASGSPFLSAASLSLRERNCAGGWLWRFDRYSNRLALREAMRFPAAVSRSYQHGAQPVVDWPGETHSAKEEGHRHFGICT